MKRKFIRLLPIWFIELLAPYIATIDTIGKNHYWRLYDDKGAGLLIKKHKKTQKMKLGNLIERITYYTGIKYIWKKIYPNCKCEERQKNLNDIELW